MVYVKSSIRILTREPPLKVTLPRPSTILMLHRSMNFALITRNETRRDDERSFLVLPVIPAPSIAGYMSVYKPTMIFPLRVNY